MQWASPHRRRSRLGIGENSIGEYRYIFELNDAQLNLAELNAQLKSAEFNGAKLIGAELKSADLSSAILDYACLEGANLSSAIVTKAHFAHNFGISEDVKKDLIQRGAIFEDDT